MYNFNHARFFADFTARTGLALSTSRRAALEFLLTQLERDPGLKLLREAAYVLATIRWETMHTFLPIKEKRFNREKNPREAARQDRYWNSGYYGRGYVQITWQDNRKVGEGLTGSRLRLDGANISVDAQTFVDNPDWVLDPQVAYWIASAGMRHGWFTGKKLGDYIGNNPPRTDYVNARRIINGLDRAADIAQFAMQFELLLRAAYWPLR